MTVEESGSPERDRATEDRTLESLWAGESGAFDRFVEVFGNRIYAFGIRMCGHREDAEDVFQDTLVTVHRKIRDLREPRALTTWLYRIVSNNCLTRRRRSKFAPEKELSLDELLPRGGVVDRGPVVPESSGPEGEVYRHELSKALDHAVRDLPPDFRVIWLMREVEGLSTEETAEALGLGVSNVKMRLHRARLALRKQLAHLHPDGVGA